MMMEMQHDYYLVHNGDDYPATFMYFAPDGIVERVMYSTPRYEVWDEVEGYGVDYFSDEETAWAKCSDLRADAGEYEAKYGEPRYWVNDSRERDFVPHWFDAFGVRYVRTDGWRGYEDAVIGDGWERYASGWVTGYPDDTVRYKLTATELYEAMVQGRIVPPFPIVWFFGVTSNVFSTVADIIIPEGSFDAMGEWLSSVEFDGDKVQRAFG